jgi:hypothetical protein
VVLAEAHRTQTELQQMVLLETQEQTQEVEPHTVPLLNLGVEPHQTTAVALLVELDFVAAHTLAAAVVEQVVRLRQ